MNETVYGKPLKMFDVTMSARKKVSETTSNLRVAVRVRPINATERGEKCTNIVKVEREKMAISLNKKSFGPFYRVYDSHTTQTEIYDDLVSSQIKKVIAGFNCTVFAYGQTGTGKTFTMEGGRNDVKSSHDDPTTGIIPRAVEDIFEQLEASGCE
uniref:Kinesin motor domain-containing protein n=2 Tax=Caenorhabditis japonica TaxID=281687 RepID=A0A8R1IKC3_CAEJA